jgi:hypothetical protein
MGNKGDVPYERLRWLSRGGGEYGIRVVKRSGAAPQWVQLVLASGKKIDHSTQQRSINSPAESANPGMLAVGAAPWYDVRSIESYSSRGPTPDGRVKPDIVGADCAEASLAPLRDGRRGFCGTSQAAPHVAGMAALVRQRFPQFSPEEVVDYLKSHAEQRGSGQPNNTWGYGFAKLPDPSGPSPSAGEFVSVSAAANHTCGVRRDGSVQCWGSNEDPDGEWLGQATPSAGKFDSVSAGFWHTCGVRRDGSVECWGWDSSGQATPPAGEFALVSAGSHHTCGLKRDGTVDCWGYDKEGQASPPDGEFISVSAGSNTCGVRRDGAVACWGAQARGVTQADFE